jgi:muramoyltetrapeptide carboxypeptidase
MVKSPALRPGDVVRVIAPASPFPADQLERGLEVLRGRLGLAPRLRADVAARHGFLAGDDARRLEEWREAVADPEARAIWAARGGFGSSRLLPAIDPSPLLERPRLLVGFSDLTALHAVLGKAGLVTVHGPVVTQLGRLPPAALDHLAALLGGTAPHPDAWSAPAPGAGLVGEGSVTPGRARGPLVGGNLTLLAHLCGTPFAPRTDGAILLLEDVEERPYRIDRCLVQLRLAGLLDRLAGVALGRFTGCDEGSLRGAAVARDAVRALGVPAVEGLPVGHEDLNLAAPLGATVTLVAPAAGEEGVPRLLFDEGAVAAPALAAGGRAR